jgi:D-beta-D-heptose 7-phosphate kinase/D-beta-D-heptose 1-phosphate adenosyltransferase
VEDEKRLTTCKTRVTAGGQQIVRFDEEEISPLSPETEERLRQACAALLPSINVCVISDYAKGVVTPGFCRWLIDEAVKLGKPVVVDPKSKDLARYRGATVITPNLKEMSAAAGDSSVHNQDELDRAALALMAQIAPSALLVTQGSDGMTLFEPGSDAYRLPAMPVEVADVSGAGDTVVAVLAIGLGSGMPLTEAASLANIAAGLAVRHVGTWAVTRDELLSQIR